MQKEIFKDIPTYENYYQVSTLGRVKSLERKVKRGSNYYLVKERILKQSINVNGYPCVGLTRYGKVRVMTVGCLSAMAFLGHTPNGHNLVIDHKDNNRLNNNLNNLQIITQRENVSKDMRKGTSKYIGVSRCNTNNKWIATISINGKQHNLGYFTDEKTASLAYQKRLYELINM